MRFVFSADIHLGSLRGLEIPFEAKLARYTGYLTSIFDVARSHDVSVVVLAGDIFDHKNVHPKVRDVLLRCLLAASDLTILIINGNHDLLEDDYTSLHFLTLLQNRERLPHVTIAEITPSMVWHDGASFVLVPFTGKQSRFNRYVKRGVKLAKKANPNDPIVVVGHEMVQGCTDDSGWCAKRSGIKLPRKSPVTFWAMGDIHKRQSLGGLPNAWYPGPPAQHKFSELPDKGVLVVDTDDPNNPEFVPIVHPDVPPLIQVEADTVEEVREALDDADENALVNLRVPSAVKAVLNDEDTIEANVVKSTPSPRQQREEADQATERIAATSEDPMLALRPWLKANKGYSDAKARYAERLARSL